MNPSLPAADAKPETRAALARRRYERAKAAYLAERTIGALRVLVAARRAAIRVGVHRSEWP